MHTSDVIYLILTLTGSILGIAISTGAILFGIGQYKAGKKQVKVTDVDTANATVKLFKDRADALDEELKKLRADFESYKKEATIKEEAFKKENAQQAEMIKTYAAILQNRNPELETFMHLLTEVAHKASKFIDTAEKWQQNTSEILKKIK
jgi:hypothetical protein